MDNLDEVLSEAGEETETDQDSHSHELTLNCENIDEIIEHYLRPSTIFPSFLFKKTKPKKVDFLPNNINGNVYYKVKCTIKNYTKKTADHLTVQHENFIRERPWQKRSEESRNMQRFMVVYKYNMFIPHEREEANFMAF